MSDTTGARSGTAERASIPPRWFIRIAWVTHRTYYRLTGGRRGLWPPRAGRWGAMRLRTVGRQSGRERVAILAYLEDGPNLATIAMNGWADPEPAWLLNLEAHPDVVVDLADGSRHVRGRVASEQERQRVWARWSELNPTLDAYAARRSRPTQVVILEPRHPSSPMDGRGGARHRGRRPGRPG
ncbi:MAG: nitroreductase family deazaflavin-dependent oxidoreductase [Chloroflexota bacterium]